MKKEHYIILENQLNTTDKRWMFLKIFYPAILPVMNLEGCPRQVIHEMVRTIENAYGDQGLASLIVLTEEKLA